MHPSLTFSVSLIIAANFQSASAQSSPTPAPNESNFWRYVEFENRERWDEEDTRPGKAVIVGCYHYSRRAFCITTENNV
jgi:hypothetical protein